ncbi:MAG: hypothetical protein R3C19_11355 [Planctomycetaceae bacterium]
MRLAEYVANNVGIKCEWQGRAESIRGADDFIDGGSGNDLLPGGFGRDVAVGGRGSDAIFGTSGDDILIAGFVTFADSHSALKQVRDEWTSDRDYETRVRNLSGVGSGPRANGDTFLTAGGTVGTDSHCDALFGGSDRDWFFFERNRDLGFVGLDEIFANELDDLLDRPEL